MLLNGSSGRARGQQTSRSRAASRGRGSTGRGASSSSSTASTTSPADPFEQERHENAQKREIRSQNGVEVNGRGARGKARGFGGKQVRFGGVTSENTSLSNNLPSSAPANPFSGASMTSVFGQPTLASTNPFAPKIASSSEMSIANVNPFGISSHNPTPKDSFGAKSAPSTNGFNPTAPVAAPVSIFGGFSKPTAWSQLGSAATQHNGIFGNASSNQTSVTPLASMPFEAPPNGTTLMHAAPARNPVDPRAPPTNPFAVTRTKSDTTAPTSNELSLLKPLFQPSQLSNSTLPLASSTSTSEASLAGKIEKLLRKEALSPPMWPTSIPGDPRQKAAMEAFWQNYKGYRTKVRASLIRAGYLDDPDKPKKLSEAIDFKGTCEDMCPEFEKITRIVEHDVQHAEKDLAPDGTYWPSTKKMVKALARSAAGQDAPLPMDVRSPAALRRTLDYLINSFLGDADNLAAVHGFLWDRTRAIRRDFVFQSSMTPVELEDQVYCLERITRFHVIALHLMSRQDVTAEDFSEQQEIEQLGKALLSLIHIYEDCQLQGVDCPNEYEFRAYYVLFNAHNPGILEVVQDWGWKYWGSSVEIQTAVKLVEALQNTWDVRGPLKPHAATDLAQNAFSRFFSIVDENSTSYTFACFAEIHFNNVRKAALQTIVESYRKQRDQTKDWNLSSLNVYLRFDDENDIVAFCETYGLHFDDINAEEYLSLESEEQISDPFPPNKQRHSYGHVERKRGNRSLRTIINSSVYEDELKFDEENELFVRQVPDPYEVQPAFSLLMPQNKSAQVPFEDGPMQTVFGHESQVVASDDGSATLPRSLSDRVSVPPPTFDSNFVSTQDARSPKAAEHEVSELQAQLFTTKESTIPPPRIFKFPASNAGTSSSSLQFIRASAPTAVEAKKFPQDLGNEPLGAVPVEIPPLAPLLEPLLNPLPSFSLGTKPNLPCQPESQTTSQSPISSPYVPVSSPEVSTPLSSALVQSPESTFPTKLANAKNETEPELQSKSTLLSPIGLKERLARISDWVALGHDGLVHQFTTSTVESILKKTYKDFMKEQTRRAIQASDEIARREAEQFRHRSLAVKYGYLWREAAHRKWLRRRGREARQARRALAENLRATKMASPSNIVDDFKASTTTKRRGSLESLLNATGVLGGFHDVAEAARSIGNHEIQDRQHKRHKSARSTPSSTLSSSVHKYEKTSNSLRRSLLSDPSYLDGKPRIHLIANYGAEDGDRRRSSGVHTDYFRLKARGITTLPNGTPLASSVMKGLLTDKRSLDEVSMPLSGQMELKKSTKSSSEKAWSKFLVRSGSPLSGLTQGEDMRKPDLERKVSSVNGRDTSQKRGLEHDDEELFERAKRIREQMDEGLEWYRREIDRDTITRSIS